MTLRKRYKRDLKHNMSLYVSSIILTVLSLLLFYLYHISGTGIMNFTEEFSKTQKIEDANFSTYQPIPDDRIKEYEKDYDLVLEKQRYINIETDDVVTRVFEKTENVDIYKLTKGKDAENDDEVVISEGFAVNQGISLGDQIKIGEKEYKISGFVERPDYLYMLQHLSDTEKNVTSFYICYMTQDEFETLDAKNCQYLVRYEKDNEDDFRKAVNDEYIMSSYVKSEDNPRIKMVIEQPKIFLEVAYLTLFVVPLLVVLLISIILSRKIKSEQKMIGTLVAYGYTNGQIIRHYAGFSAVPGVVGGILTTLVVAVFAEPYGAMGLMDYEPMQAEFKLEPWQMVLGIVIPTVMYILSTALTVRKLLKHEVTELLQGSVKGQGKVRKVLADKDVSFRLKFNLRSMIGNPGRSFVLFLGVFLGSMVILFAMATLDSAYFVNDTMAESMKGYAYQYTLNELREDDDHDGKTLLCGAVEDREGLSLTMTGADQNKLLNLKDREGNPLAIDDKYYVTSLYAKLAKVKAGDEIEIVNPLSMEKYKVKIEEVIDDNITKAIYTSRKNVSKITGISENAYNVILSDEKLDLPDNQIVSIISREGIDEQYKIVIGQMETMINLLKVIGVIVCIISVYIAVNMVVTENRSNISMLRVLGYSDKKINKLILNDNILIVLLGLILGMPCGVLASRMMFESFVDILGYLFEIHVNPRSYLFATILVLAGYYVSMYFLKRKVSKVDMVESLKDNRE